MAGSGLQSLVQSDLSQRQDPLCLIELFLYSRFQPKLHPADAAIATRKIKNMNPVIAMS
jgi:hypothetical protein